MQRQFDALQMPVDWINAVDGRTLSADVLKQQCNRNKQLMHSGKALVAGEIGCVLSHHKAYQNLLESQQSSCLILEDDVDLSRVKSDVLAECATVLDQEKPCVILLLPIKQYYKQGAIKLAGEPYQLVKAFRGLGAFAYMVNRSAAQFLLKLNQPIQHVIDPWNLIQLFYPGKVDFYATLPAVVTVDEATNADSAIDSVSSRKNNKKRSLLHVIYGAIRLRLLLSEWFQHLCGRMVKIPKGQRNTWQGTDS